MFLRNKKTDSEILFEQLTLMRDWAQVRLDSGDPDIDDVFHSTFCAADILLAIWDPQEAENEYA